MVGVEEGALQPLARVAVDQIFERKIMNLLNRVGPVGVDPDAVHVADDQQGRIFQGDAVLQQLVVGFFQIFSRALIFPRKAFLAPNVRPAFAAAGLRGTFFEGKPFAFWISRDRIDDAEQRAQIIEVALRS